MTESATFTNFDTPIRGNLDEPLAPESNGVVDRLKDLPGKLFTKKNAKAKLENIESYPGHAILWAVAAAALAKSKPLTLGVTTLAGGAILIFRDKLPSQVESLGSWPNDARDAINEDKSNLLMLTVAAILVSAMDRSPRLQGIFPKYTAPLFQHTVTAVAGLSAGHYLFTPESRGFNFSSLSEALN